MNKRPTRAEAKASTQNITSKKDVNQLKQVYRVINEAIASGLLFTIFYEPMSDYVRTNLQASGYTISIAAGRDDEHFDLISWS